MGAYVAFARIYQGVFKLVSPLMPWREPELLEGPGSLGRLPAFLKAKGIKKPLIVTDQGLAKLGVHKPLIAGLEAAGLGYALYDGTVPNPTIRNIEDALAIYRAEACDAIVALGGGSPMDCAKGVGARLARPRKSVQAMKGLLKVGRPMPPFVAVPTTAGTGSEATLAAVISNPETHEKYPINDHALIPHYAVLDPELTVGLPPHITATTGMDALTHAVEAFIGRSNSAETERDALEAARIIFADLVEAYTGGSDVERRGRLMKAAYLAGKAFTRAYVGYVHAVAHTLGGFYGVPHGLANSVLLPIVLAYYGESAAPRLAIMAKAAGVAPPDADPADAARAFIERVKAMNQALGIPERIDAIKAADVPAMVERALDEANPLYPVPRILGRAELSELYRLASG